MIPQRNSTFYSLSAVRFSLYALLLTSKSLLITISCFQWPLTAVILHNTEHSPISPLNYFPISSYLYFSISVFLYLFLYICISVHLYICTPVYLYTCISVHLHICTPAYLTLQSAQVYQNDPRLYPINRPDQTIYLPLQFMLSLKEVAISSRLRAYNF